MILGIGTDMIEIGRIKKACEKEAFLMRIYTETECRQAMGSYSRLAGSFAVKEAVSKVFGTGFSGCDPREIEVLRDERGKPYVRLYGRGELLKEYLGINRILVTITNTKEYAMAFAVGEGDEK